MRGNIRERRDIIIETVVAAFLESGKPVSSAHVSNMCGLGLSPASIRTIMKDLENEGLLTQPHTSAGRVPTVKCYRYYIRHLMPDIALSGDEIVSLARVIETGISEHDADLFLAHLASVISEVTDLLGIALAPVFEQGMLDRLEIVDLGGNSYLLVVSLKGGFINTIRVTLDRMVPRRQVEETARLLTERLSGMTLAGIRLNIARRTCNLSGGDRTLVEVIVDNCDRVFTVGDDRAVHVAGLSRTLARPEFSPADHSRKLVDLVEHKNDIVLALTRNDYDFGNVSITVGGTGPWGTRPALSLVTAGFGFGASYGAIGIIGPARIPYPKLAAVVKYAASFTAQYFIEN